MMARLVRHTATGPYKIEPVDMRPIFICGCGLSQNMPFCDGSHKGCRSEEPGKVYVYDEGRRTVIEVRDED
jgi:CDGSH-type Zn-finger protein